MIDGRRPIQIKTKELASQEKRCLEVIKEEDLPDMRNLKREERLVAEISKHEKEPPPCYRMSAADLYIGYS